RPGLRRVIDRLLDSTDTLIATARGLPGAVKSPGLSRECAAIVALATRLAARLRRGDPLAMRVKLSPIDFALATLIGLVRGGRA
ncbi:MAG: squalene synthase HpnC, partial [Stellaceae bacterium]